MQIQNAKFYFSYFFFLFTLHKKGKCGKHRKENINEHNSLLKMSSLNLVNKLTESNIS